MHVDCYRPKVTSSRVTRVPPDSKPKPKSRFSRPGLAADQNHWTSEHATEDSTGYIFNSWLESPRKIGSRATSRRKRPTSHVRKSTNPFCTWRVHLQQRATKVCDFWIGEIDTNYIGASHHLDTVAQHAFKVEMNQKNAVNAALLFIICA
jgi:hypothetical protein